MALMLVGMAAVTGVGPAGAAPGDTVPALGLDDIGSSTSLSFVGQQAEVSIAIPVPDGLTPATIRGTTELPAFVTGGVVDVLQGERLLSRTPIGTTPTAGIELPLRGIRVAERAANIVLRTYLNTEGYCRFDPDNTFRILDTSITYSGTEATPTTVAQFLQPVLRELTIYVPDDVSREEGAAAVNLATAVVANYGTAPVPVTTRSLPRTDMVPPARPGALQRQVIISTDAPAGLTLQNGPGGPYLSIGGSGDELVAQTQFLASNLAAIALSSSAVAGPSQQAPLLAPKVSTLGDIGVGDQLVTSMAWPSIAFGIDQTRLGRPSDSVRVQLKGTYTSGTGSTSRLTARIGNTVLASWEGDDTGTYDRWVDVPDGLLSRYTEVTVTLERGDLREGCGTGVRSSLSLDSSGEVTSQPADPPVPGGFGSLPQSLMPRAALAWTKGDVRDVARAVSLATAMQRMSSVPIGFDVESVDDAKAATRPAIIIAADGTGIDDVTLPVSADGSTLDITTLAGDRASVTLNPGIDYGAIQVARADGHTLLVATSTDDVGDLDALLQWLDADPQRWSGLQGNAILQVAGQQPVMVPTSSASGRSAVSRSGSGGWSVAIVAAVAVGAALLAAAVGALVVLLTRRRPRGEADVTNGGDDAIGDDTVHGDDR